MAKGSTFDEIKLTPLPAREHTAGREHVPEQAHIWGEEAAAWLSFNRVLRATAAAGAGEHAREGAPLIQRQVEREKTGTDASLLEARVARRYKKKERDSPGGGGAALLFPFSCCGAR